MKKAGSILLFLCALMTTYGQESFTIRRYAVDVLVNKNASLDFAETIDVHFTEPRHGIVRSIQYQYPKEKLPAGVEKAQRQMETDAYTRIILDNIKVSGKRFAVSKKGSFVNIKIGSADRFVTGNQRYVIRYRVLNAINFFSNHSELYYNLIGNQWNTTIDSVDFKIDLPAPLADTPYYFIATGFFGSRENNSRSEWVNSSELKGNTLRPLKPYEGLTIGIAFPGNYLEQQNYSLRGIGWLALPLMVFMAMLFTWKKWGKDDDITVTTQYYPPENIIPSIAGYIIDNKLDRRDLTALLPWWGAGGFLEVHEIAKNKLAGILKGKDYEFVKLKDLPESAFDFEKTLFERIFGGGSRMRLSSLKNVLYKTVNTASSQLKHEIDRDDYYVKYSRGLGCLFPFIGFLAAVLGFLALVDDLHEKLWLGCGLVASGIVLISFGIAMTKRTQKGTVLYQQLLGFREFIKTVERDRLQQFLKEDENYFDKVLPYAIVFGVAGKWKDKLKGLDIPPPKWYYGDYSNAGFNMTTFMNSLDHSMNEIGHSFYSSPSSASSGGSFGSGGFSGGGLGGGGGSSW